MTPVSIRQRVASPLSMQPCRRRRGEAKRAAKAAGARNAFVAAAAAAADVSPTSTSTTSTTTTTPPPRPPPPPSPPPRYQSLIGQTLEDLEHFVVSELGEPRSRASQLYRWLYSGGGARVEEEKTEGKSFSSPSSPWDLAPAAPGAQGGFSSSFLDKVRGHPELLDPGIELSGVLSARDGTRKLLFRVTSGPARGKTVDAVVIPAFDPKRPQAKEEEEEHSSSSPSSSPPPPPPPRLTLCVSSQAGCAMGCAFCLTGAQGLSGSLSPAQIVSQLVAARRWLREEQERQRRRQGKRGKSDDVDVGDGENGDGGENGENGGDGSGDGGDNFIPVPSGAITNVVFMGQGEPLDNVDAVVAAVQVMTDPRAGSSFSFPTSSSTTTTTTTKEKRQRQQKRQQQQQQQQQQWALSPNRVTVSTVGLVPQLRSLSRRCDAQVALSLHAAAERTRASIVPATARHGTAELKGALEELFPRLKNDDDGEKDHSSSSPAAAAAAAPKRAGRGKRRHCLIELTLLSGINDSDEDARALVSYLENVEAKVNLIPFNVHRGSPFSPPSDERVEAFRRIVVDEGGRVCTVRVARGADEAMAACGQLGEKVGIIPRAAARLAEAARREG